jgi:hypothetical protein
MTNLKVKLSLHTHHDGIWRKYRYTSTHS